MNVVQTNTVQEVVYVNANGIVYPGTREWTEGSSAPNSTWHVMRTASNCYYDSANNSVVIYVPTGFFQTTTSAGGWLVVPAFLIDNYLLHHQSSPVNIIYLSGVYGIRINGISVTAGELYTAGSSYVDETNMSRKYYVFVGSTINSDTWHLYAIQYSYNNTKGDFRKIAYPLVYTTVNTDQYTITNYTYEYHIIGSDGTPYDQSISGDFLHPYFNTSHYTDGACDLTNTVLFEDCKSGYVDQKLGWYSFNDDGNPLVIKDKPKTLVNADYNQSVGTFSTSQISGWDGQWEPPLYVIIQWDTAKMKEMDCLKLFNFDENYHAFVYYDGSMETVADGKFYILRLFEYKHTSTSSYTKDNKEWLKLEGTNTLAYTRATTTVGPNNYGGISEENCLNACYINTPGEFYGRYFYYNTSTYKWVERTYVPYIWRNLEPFYIYTPNGNNNVFSIGVDSSSSTAGTLIFAIIKVNYDTNQIDTSFPPYHTLTLGGSVSFNFTVEPGYKYYIFRCDTIDNPNNNAFAGLRFYETTATSYYHIGGNLTSIYCHPTTTIAQADCIDYFQNQSVKFWYEQRVSIRADYAFDECYYLTDASRLEFPLYVNNYSYYSMFDKCTSLSKPPLELPAIRDEGGQYYRSMFAACTSLPYTPIIYMPNMLDNGEECLCMFMNCSALNTAYLKITKVQNTLGTNVIGFGPNGGSVTTTGNVWDMFTNCPLEHIYKLPYALCAISSSAASTTNFNGFCGANTNYTITVHDITDNTNSTSVLLSNVKRN